MKILLILILVLVLGACERRGPLEEGAVSLRAGPAAEMVGGWR